MSNRFALFSLFATLAMAAAAVAFPGHSTAWLIVSAVSGFATVASAVWAFVERRAPPSSPSALYKVGNAGKIHLESHRYDGDRAIVDAGDVGEISSKGMFIGKDVSDGR